MKEALQRITGEIAIHLKEVFTFSSFFSGLKRNKGRENSRTQLNRQHNQKLLACVAGSWSKNDLLNFTSNDGVVVGESKVTAL